MVSHHGWLALVTGRAVEEPSSKEPNSIPGKAFTCIQRQQLEPLVPAREDGSPCARNEFVDVLTSGLCVSLAIYLKLRPLGPGNYLVVAED